MSLLAIFYVVTIGFMLVGSRRISRSCRTCYPSSSGRRPDEDLFTSPRSFWEITESLREK
jgi:hypothetical protein